MFDIGFWELAILFGLGLVVLGPEKLPRVASQLGNWAGQARRMARNLSAQMKAEVDLDKPDLGLGGNSINPGATKSPNEVKPSWQTSAGLRPGYSSDEEIAAAHAPDDADESTDEASNQSGHGEYEPLPDEDFAAPENDDKKS